MTVVCLGCGPSLTQEDVDHCSGRATVIAINEAYRMAPWADILYAADEHWWARRQGVPDFEGRKIGCNIDPQGMWPGLESFESDGMEGLSDRARALRTGVTSGYQAIGLAVQLGADRIILLGYDYQASPEGEHHFPGYMGRRHADYADALRYYDSLVWPLYDRNIRVVNCSTRTALTVFPRHPLREELL